MTVLAAQQDLLSLAVRRLRLLPRGHAGVDTRKKLVFLTELAGLGYRVENPEAYDDSLLDRYSDLIAVLREMRGGDVAYVPLFTGFPAEVPDDDRYFAKRLLGYYGSLCRVFDGGTRLDSGMVVPDWLFDLRQFGADPVLQTQDAALQEAGLAAQAARQGDTHVEWIPLRIAEALEVEARALQFLWDCLYARTSIQEALKPDLDALLDRFSTVAVDPARVVFKETRTYLMRRLWQQGDDPGLASYCDTPTDLLRLFAALTDGDISLAEKVRFPKMTRRQRRFVLERLEACPSLAEDLQHYRGLWLAVGRGLHPGAEGSPRTKAAFDTLRNGHVVTFEAQVEDAVRRRDVDALIARLSERPGVFARRLHQALERAGDRAHEVVQAFARVADAVSLKNLLMLETYFRTIEDSPVRAVINKAGKLRTMPNRMHRLGTGVTASVGEVLHAAITRAIQARFPSWQGRRAWVDPALRSYTVPLQQRKASDGMLTLGRGTRLPLDTGKVLRLFVWWKEATKRTDLDLSVIQFDRDLKCLGHVSYTNLSADGIVHSGDLQSAPFGAAEFVDLDLVDLAVDSDCRYIAPQIYLFCGNGFREMECHAGWMIRAEVDPDYASFDVKTVQNKLDLSGAGSYSLPLVVDLWDRTLIYVDLYVNGAVMHNRVEGAVGDVSSMVGEVARFLHTRPNLQELALHHVRARGAALAESREDADLSFAVSGGDFGPDRMERILSDLL